MSSRMPGARLLSIAFAIASAMRATPATATPGDPTTTSPTGFCDISPGEYTSWTGTEAALETASSSTPGVSQARCFKDIRSLGGFVIEDVFKDSKGRYANELPAYAKLVNMWPGEPANSVCNGEFPVGKRNTPASFCSGTTSTPKTFIETSASANALDWKYINPVRFNPLGRTTCPSTWPAMGCFGGRCYDAGCVLADGTLKACGGGEICKAGACVAGSASSLPGCANVANVGAPGVVLTNGQDTNYNPWNAPVFDMGGLANKVALFAVNDHGPQPCESIEFTVYLTNNPASRKQVENPAAAGPDPNAWNRAKLFKIYTHGWIDNPNCCTSPRDCGAVGCVLPKPGENPVLEADAMTLVYALPCGVTFRYAAIIPGYDGRSLGDPAVGQDRCAYHSFDAEIDAVAGLNDDESAICPDKDGDGYPSCECTPKPSKCDCIDDPAVNPNAAKYHPGAPQTCDGPEYSCTKFVCPTGTSCVNSKCLRPCESGEFKCPGGFECQTLTPDGGPATKVCVPAPCGTAGTCPEGHTCKAGTCTDPCAAPTKCPAGQLCKEGTCKDPCATVSCPGGETCNEGKCGFPCACLAETAIGYPCNEPNAKCEIATSTCVARGCESKGCPAGQKCVGTESGPVCKGMCTDVVCPGKQVCDPVKGCADKCDLLAAPCPSGKVCFNGACVDPVCANVECDPPFECRDGRCVEADAGIVKFDSAVPEDTFVVPDASVPDTAAKAPAPAPPPEGGCGCTVPGTRAATSITLLAALATLLGASLRRRMRR